MKTLFSIISFSLFSFLSIGQTTFNVESDNFYPDFKLKISEEVFYPDMSIKIGKNVYYADFTVGITQNKSQADFIITKSSYADYKIQAGDDIFYPDFSIKAGPDIFYPDLSIKIMTSGTVDYIVYTEKEFITLRDLVSSLLPVINFKTDFKHKKLNDLFE